MAGGRVTLRLHAHKPLRDGAHPSDRGNHEDHQHGFQRHRNSAKRIRTTLALAIVAALCAPGAFAAAGAGSPAPVARTAHLQPGDAVVGALPMTQPMHVSVALNMRDRAGLDAFIANAAANQKKGVFAEPMTSAQFMASHAPTQAQAQAVVDYLASKGYTNIQIAPNRMAVTARWYRAGDGARCVHDHVRAGGAPTMAAIAYANNAGGAAHVPAVHWPYKVRGCIGCTPSTWRIPSLWSGRRVSASHGVLFS